MKSRVLASVAALVLVSASTASAQLTQVSSYGALAGPRVTETFESGFGGLGATYTFNAGSPTTGAAGSYAGGVTPSGSNGLSSTSFPAILTITFSSAVQSLGLTFGNDDTCCSQGFTAFLDLFGTSGLLGTVGVVANMNDFADQFIGVNSTVGITSAQFRYGSGNDVGLYTYVDDVSFAAAATTVPEPSTYALLAAGLAGMFGMARRRRA